MLKNRFPGLYIPPVPRKTTMSTTGKKDEAVVRERRYFLDLFLKECASLKYLGQSKELQIFLRPQGDLSQLMQKQFKPKLVDILTTYRATLPVVEVSAPHAVDFRKILLFRVLSWLFTNHDHARVCVFC